jgi:pilus assembly protein CpaD
MAPDCETAWNDMARARPNQTWPRFGCATANNLANMVADPRDLVAPRTMDAPDSGRRQTVLDNYRQGENTASQRSDRESGAVSSSVGN